LPDGTPAREVEYRMVWSGTPVNPMGLAVKKGDLQVRLSVIRPGGRVGEDLKAILYSIEFQPGKDESVKPPPDIQEFLDKWCSAVLSHDLTKVRSHISDRYLNSGARKGEMERFWMQRIGLITSYRVSITDSVPSGDRVYVTGFTSQVGEKWMLSGTSIIKESGEWKWYGNQRDVSP
jgi:hypothetical protein